MRKMLTRAALLLFMGLSFSVLFSTYLGLERLKQRIAYEEFKQDAIKDMLLLQEELDLVQENVAAFSALFMTFPSVSEQSFMTFAQPLLALHPCFKMMAWIAIEPIVKESLADERQGQRLLDVRDYALTYVYPETQKKRYQGYPLGLHSSLLQAMEKARDENQAIALNALDLNQDENTKGMLYIQPIYSAQSVSLYERRQYLQGYIIAWVDLDVLMSETGLKPEQRQNISFDFQEITPQDKQVFTLKHPLSFGQHTWQVSVKRAKSAEPYFDWLPWMGTAILALLLVILWGTIFWYKALNSKASKIIREKTMGLSLANDMLQAMHTVSQQFIHDDDPHKIFDKILQDLIHFTESKFGLVGQVVQEGHHRFIQTLAISNIAWDYESRKYYREHYEKGIIFDNPKSLFGALLQSEDCVIANHPSQDSRAAGVPCGHPTLNSFMGIPLFHQGVMVGVACLANRPKGYNQTLIKTLQPFIGNCGFMISEYLIKKERFIKEAQNYQRARNDQLTGLPNRFLLQEQGEKLLQLAIRKQHPLAVMYLDLDNFKPVNDRYGHEVGDKLLAKVASILKENTRSSDFVARLGGDEFVILLSAVTNQKEPQILADKLSAIFAHPIQLENLALVVELSIGVAMYPQDGKSLEQLLNASDKAMYQAKYQGKHQIHRPSHQAVTLVVAKHDKQNEAKTK